MPSGVTDLTAIQTLDPKPVVRAARPVDDQNSFDRVLDRQRKATDKPKPEKPQDDASAKPADAKKRDDTAKKSDGAKKGDGKKLGKKVAQPGDDVDHDPANAPDVATDADSTATIKPPAADVADHDDEDTDKPADAKAPKSHAADGKPADETTPTDPAVVAVAVTPVNKTAADATAAAADKGQDVAVDSVASTAAQALAEKPIATAAGSADSATDATETKPAAHAANNSADVDQKPVAALDAEKEIKPDAKNQKVTAVAQATDDAGTSGNAGGAAGAAKPAAAKNVQTSAPAVDVATIAPSIPHAKIAAPPPAAQTVAAGTTPERAVAASNVDRIVTSVRGNLGANGGTMQIRLDPPTLGTVNVQVSFENGVMTASMQTENEQATRMLSHSLGDLKASLESAGVSVDKIQVKQAAPSEQASSGNQHSGEKQSQDKASYNDSSRQEQQRREMLQRMWRKLSIGTDDLDLVA